MRETAKYLRPGAIRAWAAFDRQQQCIYRAIRAQLPRGAAVYLQARPVHRLQRLAELSAAWAVPQASPATAHWVLTLVRGPACSGVQVRVRRA